MSFLHMEIERWHPPCWSFRFHDANTSIWKGGPSLKHIASFAWCGTNFGKMRISGFELRQAEVQNRDCKYLSCETCYLVCMLCDSRGFSLSFNSQFPGFSMFRRYSLWAKSTSVNEAYYQDPILDTAQKQLKWSSHGEDGFPAEAPEYDSKYIQTIVQ